MFGHRHDVLPRVRQVNRPLPCHHPKYIKREQRPSRMDLAIRPLDEIGDYVRPLPIRMLHLKIEARVFLVALGEKRT